MPSEFSQADCCSEPLDIFNFMKENGIGEYVSLFYEAWAIVYEQRRQYQQAEKTYEKGIQM